MPAKQQHQNAPVGTRPSSGPPVLASNKFASRDAKQSNARYYELPYGSDSKLDQTRQSMADYQTAPQSHAPQILRLSEDNEDRNPAFNSHVLRGHAPHVRKLELLQSTHLASILDSDRMLSPQQYNASRTGPTEALPRRRSSLSEQGFDQQPSGPLQAPFKGATPGPDCEEHPSARWSSSQAQDGELTASAFHLYGASSFTRGQSMAHPQEDDPMGLLMKLSMTPSLRACPPPVPSPNFRKCQRDERSSSLQMAGQHPTRTDAGQERAQLKHQIGALFKHLEQQQQQLASATAVLMKLQAGGSTAAPPPPTQVTDQRQGHQQIHQQIRQQDPQTSHQQNRQHSHQQVDQEARQHHRMHHQQHHQPSHLLLGPSMHAALHSSQEAGSTRSNPDSDHLFPPTPPAFFEQRGAGVEEMDASVPTDAASMAGGAAVGAGGPGAHQCGQLQRDKGLAGACSSQVQTLKQHAHEQAIHHRRTLSDLQHQLEEQARLRKLAEDELLASREDLLSDMNNLQAQHAHITAWTEELQQELKAAELQRADQCSLEAQVQALSAKNTAAEVEVRELKKALDSVQLRWQESKRHNLHLEDDVRSNSEQLLEARQQLQSEVEKRVGTQAELQSALLQLQVMQQQLLDAQQQVPATRKQLFGPQQQASGPVAGLQEQFSGVQLARHETEQGWQAEGGQPRGACSPSKSNASKLLYGPSSEAWDEVLMGHANYDSAPGTPSRRHSDGAMATALQGVAGVVRGLECSAGVAAAGSEPHARVQSHAQSPSQAPSPSQLPSCTRSQLQEPSQLQSPSLANTLPHIQSQSNLSEYEEQMTQLKLIARQALSALQSSHQSDMLQEVTLTDQLQKLCRIADKLREDKLEQARLLLDVTQQVAELQQVVQSQREELQQLQEESSQVPGLKKQVELLQQECEDCKEDSKQKQVELEQAQHARKSEAQKLFDVNQQVAELESTVVCLRQELQQAHEGCRQLPALKQQLELLQQDCEDCKAELQQYQEAHEQARQASKTGDDRLLDATRQVAELEQEVQYKRELLQQLRKECGQLPGLRQQIDLLQQDCEKYRAKAHQGHAALEQSKQALELEVRERAAIEEKLQQQLALYAERSNLWSSTVESLQLEQHLMQELGEQLRRAQVERDIEIEAASSQLAMLDDLEQALQHARQEADTETAKYVEAAAQALNAKQLVEQLDAEVTSLRKQFQQQKAEDQLTRQQEVRELSSEVASLTEQLQQQSEEMALLKSASSEYERQLNENKSAASNLEQQLDLYKSASSELEKQLDMEKSTSTELERQLEMHKAASFEQESKLDLLRVQYDEQVKAKEAVLDQQEQLVGDLMARLGRLQEEIQQQAAAAAVQEAGAMQVQQDLLAWQDKFAKESEARRSVELECAKHQQAHAAAVREVAKCQQVVADTTEELEFCQKAHAEVVEELRDLQKANADAFEELRASQKAYADATEELQRSQQAVAGAIKEVKRLKDELEQQAAETAAEKATSWRLEQDLQDLREQYANELGVRKEVEAAMAEHKAQSLEQEKRWTQDVLLRNHAQMEVARLKQQVHGLHQALCTPCCRHECGRGVEAEEGSYIIGPIPSVNAHGTISALVPVVKLNGASSSVHCGSGELAVGCYLSRGDSESWLDSCPATEAELEADGCPNQAQKVTCVGWLPGHDHEQAALTSDSFSEGVQALSTDQYDSTHGTRSITDGDLTASGYNADDGAVCGTGKAAGSSADFVADSVTGADTARVACNGAFAGNATGQATLDGSLPTSNYNCQDSSGALPDELHKKIEMLEMSNAALLRSLSQLSSQQSVLLTENKELSRRLTGWSSPMANGFGLVKGHWQQATPTWQADTQALNLQAEAGEDLLKRGSAVGSPPLLCVPTRSPIATGLYPAKRECSPSNLESASSHWQSAGPGSSSNSSRLSSPFAHEPSPVAGDTKEALTQALIKALTRATRAEQQLSALLADKQHAERQLASICDERDWLLAHATCELSTEVMHKLTSEAHKNEARHVGSGCSIGGGVSDSDPPSDKHLLGASPEQAVAASKIANLSAIVNSKSPVKSNCFPDQAHCAGMSDLAETTSWPHLAESTPTADPTAFDKTVPGPADCTGLPDLTTPQTLLDLPKFLTLPGLAETSGLQEAQHPGLESLPTSVLSPKSARFNIVHLEHRLLELEPLLATMQQQAESLQHQLDTQACEYRQLQREWLMQETEIIELSATLSQERCRTAQLQDEVAVQEMLLACNEAELQAQRCLSNELRVELAHARVEGTLALLESIDHVCPIPPSPAPMLCAGMDSVYGGVQLCYKHGFTAWPDNGVAAGAGHDFASWSGNGVAAWLNREELNSPHISPDNSPRSSSDAAPHTSCHSTPFTSPLKSSHTYADPRPRRTRLNPKDSCCDTTPRASCQNSPDASPVGTLRLGAPRDRCLQELHTSRNDAEQPPSLRMLDCYSNAALKEWDVLLMLTAPSRALPPGKLVVPSEDVNKAMSHLVDVVDQLTTLHAMQHHTYWQLIQAGPHHTYRSTDSLPCSPLEQQMGDAAPDICGTKRGLVCSPRKRLRSTLAAMSASDTWAASLRAVNDANSGGNNHVAEPSSALPHSSTRRHYLPPHASFPSPVNRVSFTKAQLRVSSISSSHHGPVARARQGFRSRGGKPVPKATFPLAGQHVVWSDMDAHWYNNPITTLGSSQTGTSCSLSQSPYTSPNAPATLSHCVQPTDTPAVPRLNLEPSQLLVPRALAPGVQATGLNVHLPPADLACTVTAKTSARSTINCPGHPCSEGSEACYVPPDCCIETVAHPIQHQHADMPVLPLPLPRPPATTTDLCIQGMEPVKVATPFVDPTFKPASRASSPGSDMLLPLPPTRSSGSQPSHGYAPLADSCQADSCHATADGFQGTAQIPLGFASTASCWESLNSVQTEPCSSILSLSEITEYLRGVDMSEEEAGGVISSPNWADHEGELGECTCCAGRCCAGLRQRVHATEWSNAQLALQVEQLQSETKEVLEAKEKAVMGLAMSESEATCLLQRAELALRNLVRLHSVCKDDDGEAPSDGETDETLEGVRDGQGQRPKVAVRVWHMLLHDMQHYLTGDNSAVLDEVD